MAAIQRNFRAVQHLNRLVFCGVGLAAALFAGAAQAASQDAAAQELADQAIFTDYLQLDFKSAESKLKKALGLCEKGTCSPTVHAQVYRDLAVIYITGMKRQDDGRTLLVKALRLDRSLALDADLTTPDLVKIFAEAKEEVSKVPDESAAAKPAPPSKASEPAAAAEEDEEEDAEEEPVGSMDEDPSADCPPDFPGCEDVAAREEQEQEEARAAEEEAKFGLRNWLSAALQQDFLMFSAGSGVCGTSRPAELSCFRAGDTFRDPSVEGTAGDAGEVGGGFTFATTRLLLGYERMFLPNLSAGARVGYAIGGGPAEPNGPGFVPIHAEVRGSYWFAPFEVGRIRPYAGVSGGLAQVDSSVTTQIVDRNAQGQIALSRVTVWKKTGTVFASVGGGALYPINAKGGVTAELRAALLFPSSGMSVALQAGYTYGF